MARPRIEIDVEEVRRLAACGLRRRQICMALGISEDTLARRANEDEAFEAALTCGRAQGLAEVADALYQRALAGDVRAQMFYLRSRAAWNVPLPKHYLEPEEEEEADERFAPWWPPALIRRVLNGFRPSAPQNPQNALPSHDDRGAE